MLKMRIPAALLWIAAACHAQVSHADGKWTIAGGPNRVELDESTLAVRVQAGSVEWNLLPSAADDMLVRAGDDELVAEATAIEHSATLRELNWPKETDGRPVDYTLIPSDDGTMLPRNWPKLYQPIHRAAGDHTVIQSHLIETWAMSWWGFLQGAAGMMVIVETPDDAAYTFQHPAGGPTRMCPSWRAQLGHFAYTRRLRMVFLPKGGYVALAKRYRRYVMDSGLYVSLKEKIARAPVVQNLVGSPVMGLRVLRNLKPGSARYDARNPANNYRLSTFAEDAARLRELKKQGWTHLNVSLSGWLNQGYDRQTPDALPPAEAAGGWTGMKQFFDTCQEVDYTCWLHDQYRDYYQDPVLESGLRRT
jgi:hypothetical protein